MVLDVVPLDAELVDADAEDVGDPEAGAGRGADAEEDAEAGLGLERAVAEEREVPRLAGELDRSDLHLRPNRLERDELLVGARSRVEPEVAGAQGRSEEHTSELQSRVDLVCRHLL